MLNDHGARLSRHLYATTLVARADEREVSKAKYEQMIRDGEWEAETDISSRGLVDVRMGKGKKAETIRIKDYRADALSRWPSQWTDAEVKVEYNKYKNSSTKPANWVDIKSQYEMREREIARLDASVDGKGGEQSIVYDGRIYVRKGKQGKYHIYEHPANNGKTLTLHLEDGKSAIEAMRGDMDKRDWEGLEEFVKEEKQEKEHRKDSTTSNEIVSLAEKLGSAFNVSFKRDGEGRIVSVRAEGRDMTPLSFAEWARTKVKRGDNLIGPGVSLHGVVDSMVEQLNSLGKGASELVERATRSDAAGKWEVKLKSTSGDVERTVKVALAKNEDEAVAAAKRSAGDDYSWNRVSVKRADASFPQQVKHKGRTYYKTGKTGTEFKTGLASLEYEEEKEDPQTKRIEKTGWRVWVNEKGVVTED